MRKAMLLCAVLAACSKAETKTDSSAAAAAATPAPAAPANLTPAMIAGTWNGESKAEGKDSVVTRWTVVSMTDSTGKIVITGSKDTIPFKTTFSADSFLSTSGAYTDPGLPKKTGKVMFHAVGRLKDGKLVGTSTLMLAAKMDSVIGKTTWEATKAP